eukprot:SAG11_NODE_230_length_11943_cov_73.442962_8_plen_136_part_00
MFDPYMAPASTNGIGTVVFGNCGCGFAPCVREDREFLIELMEGVEDIPKAALEAGMGDWGWETFPQWLEYAAGAAFRASVFISACISIRAPTPPHPPSPPLLLSLLTRGCGAHAGLTTACDFAALIAHGAVRHRD